jgi:hypothetical protein
MASTFVRFFRFTTETDAGWFTRSMTRVVSEDLGEPYIPLLEANHYFVDFLKLVLSRDVFRGGPGKTLE